MSTAEAVLRILRKGKRVSGEAIAKELKVSRNAIWKAMNSLRELGYGIDGDAKGYSLNSIPDLLLPFELAEALSTKFMGRNIEHHRTIGSTNERARELAEEGAPEGTIVVSEEQKVGKGRLGREWVSPEGGIWMSLVLRPEVHPSEAPVLTLCGGVAVATAIRGIGLEATLKWPNDVLVQDLKVCGLLTEMSGDMDRVTYIVMGFGVNANFRSSDLPEPVRAQATTLLDARGSPVDRKALVSSILAEFESLYLKGGTGAIIERWKDLTSTIGKRVRMTTPRGTIEGLAKDVGPDGALVVELDSGDLETIYSGDCQHLRRA